MIRKVCLRLLILCVVAQSCNGTPLSDSSQPSRRETKMPALEGGAWLAGEQVSRGEEVDACIANSIEIPAKMPTDPTKCGDEGNVKGRSSNGWSCVGSIANKNLFAGGVADAPLWVYKTAETLCHFMPRPTDNASGQQGMLCFNVKSCAACAFDARNEWVDRPEDMGWGPFAATSCESCHHSGFLYPSMQALQLLANYTDDLLALSTSCATRGGPLWIRQKGQVDMRKPTDADFTDSPKECSRCHGAFRTKWSKEYCKFAKTALTDTVSGKPDWKGSMTQYLHKVSPDECASLSKSVGCDLPCAQKEAQSPTPTLTVTSGPFQESSPVSAESSMPDSVPDVSGASGFVTPNSLPATLIPAENLNVAP